MFAWITRRKILWINQYQSRSLGEAKRNPGNACRMCNIIRDDWSLLMIMFISMRVNPGLRFGLRYPHEFIQVYLDITYL